jgi:integration host factor subunit alpha
MTLTKARLTDLLFERLGLSKREADDMIVGFFAEIGRALQAGEPVSLSGFGNFQVRAKSRRPGRNPRTGEAVTISARRVVIFHASPGLRALVEARLR